ncbi:MULTISPECIES: FAD-dependent oxidoreductase [Paenibacillus]|uniref:NAD(P)/FAD-dependent oxidoreductase n=1 Tax=Paenibacillus TaxID=44249 RepID=UPI002FE05138
MQLHTGSFYWHRNMERIPRYPALTENLACDCLIIGGGISGALCAYLLGKLGISALLAERNRIASGSTLANTGILQYANDKTLTSLIHTFGEQAAVHYYRLCQEALIELKEIGRELAPEYPLQERSSLYLASREAEVALLRREYETLTRHGFSVEWWDEAELATRFPFRRPAAIYTQGDAEIHPVALTHSLLGEAEANGVRIFEDSPITGWSFQEDGVVCRSGQVLIHAQQVIFATGYETQLLKKEPGASLAATYVVVTEPTDHFRDWHEGALIWETARPYLYLRTTPDGRIMAGGLDEPLKGGGLQEGRELRQSDKLLEHIHALFPRKKQLKTAYAWGAVFGETRDGLPYIGTHPDYPNCYFLENYGGNGTVCAMLAARMITDKLAGKPRPDMDWFSLSRSTRPSPL